MEETHFIKEVQNIYSFILRNVVNEASKHPRIGEEMIHGILRRSLKNLNLEYIISISRDFDIEFKTENEDKIIRSMNSLLREVRVNLAIVVGAKKAFSILEKAIDLAKKKYGLIKIASLEIEF